MTEFKLEAGAQLLVVYKSASIGEPEQAAGRQRDHSPLPLSLSIAQLPGLKPEADP